MTEKKTVQCPSCHTTFAVDAKLLEGKEQERFHCSRCDHLFNLELIAETPAAAPEVEHTPTISEIAAQVTAEQINPAPSETHETPAAQEAMTYPTFDAPTEPTESEPTVSEPTVSEPTVSEPTVSEPTEAGSINDWFAAAEPTPETQAPAEPTPPVAEEIFHPEESRPGSALEMFQQLEEADPDVSSVPGKLSNTGEDLTSVPSTAQGSLAKGPVQSGFDFPEVTVSERDTPPGPTASAEAAAALEELAAAETTEIPPDAAGQFRTQPAQEVASTPEPLQEDPAPMTAGVEMGPPPVQEELPGTREEDISAAATAELFEQFSPEALMADTPRVFVGFRSIAVVSAPILLFLLILGGASYFLQSNNTVSSQFAALFTSQPQVAPPGLLVENTAFEPVSLPTGERVYLISGKISNHTTDDVHDVIIEGVAFDEGGSPLSSIRTAAANTIEKKELDLMSVDNIEKLQQMRGAKRVVIPAGAEKKFSVALVEDQGKEPQFYTARIFSVSL